MPRGNSTKCPHCGSTCRTIKTAQVTATYREVVFLCRNPACNCMFTAAITPVREIEPSANPNPEARFPASAKQVLA